MERNFLPDARPRASTGAFHDYVRGVFADRSEDRGRLAEARADWLRRLGGLTTVGGQRAARRART